MRQADKERQEAVEQLRKWIKPGDTVYTILDHVSRSGMMRHIRVVLPQVEAPSEEMVFIKQHTAETCPGRPCSTDCDHVEFTRDERPKVDFFHPNYLVAKAIGASQVKKGDGIRMGGCGMDMGFSLVYELSHALFGEGYQCLGKGKCPSAYHSNHRDTVYCPGVGEGETYQHCYRAELGDGFKQVIEGVEVSMRPHVVELEGQVVVCPTCKGEGRIANPEGPERFDLVHRDGYALKHRWL